MLIYLLLVLGIAAFHHLYFGDPLATLWLSQDYPPAYLSDRGYLVEEDVILGVVLGLIVVQLSRWLSAHTTWAKRVDDDFCQYFDTQSSLALTGLAVMSSLSEEIVFRGWLQDLTGLAWASLIFGLLHIPPKRSHWPWTVSATVMGFTFGALYVWRGSITAPFIAHFTINYFNLHALAKLGRSKRRERSESI